MRFLWHDDFFLVLYVFVKFFGFPLLWFMTALLERICWGEKRVSRERESGRGELETRL